MAGPAGDGSIKSTIEADKVIAVARINDSGSPIDVACDRIVTGPAQNRHIAASACVGVIACVRIHLIDKVRISINLDIIIAVAAVDHAGAAVDFVRNRVVAIATKDDVGTFTTVQDVVASTTVQRVVAARAVKAIAVNATDQSVIAVATGDRHRKGDDWRHGRTEVRSPQICDRHVCQHQHRLHAIIAGIGQHNGIATALSNSQGPALEQIFTVVKAKVIGQLFNVDPVAARVKVSHNAATAVAIGVSQHDGVGPCARGHNDPAAA